MVEEKTKKKKKKRKEKCSLLWLNPTWRGTAKKNNEKNKHYVFFCKESRREADPSNLSVPVVVDTVPVVVDMVPVVVDTTVDTSMVRCSCGIVMQQSIKPKLGAELGAGVTKNTPTSFAIFSFSPSVNTEKTSKTTFVSRDPQ